MDASHASNIMNMLYKYFREVLFFRPENVVRIVANNVANYVPARILLKMSFLSCFGLPVQHIASI